MDGDNEGIMTGRMLARALGQQPYCVAIGQP
jgi:hypothetical protein